MDDKTDGQTEELIDLAHFFTITRSQVIIDRNDMGAFSREGVQIDRQGCNQCFPFAGSHFGYITAV